MLLLFVFPGVCMTLNFLSLRFFPFFALHTSFGSLIRHVLHIWMHVTACVRCVRTDDDDYDSFH